MSLRDETPIHRCSVPACPFIGRWPEGGRCPEHRVDPPRQPTLIEQWEVETDE